MLRAFGLAYDRFPAGQNGPHDPFLDQAVAELAVDGKVAPVRLALFAQMIKDKPWAPVTLKDVRGLKGIGVKFLEESLSGPAAAAGHPSYLPDARFVLAALLPEGGADIKGHMMSRQELLRAARYERRPEDFDALLSFLDTDLRLITPADPKTLGPGERAQPAGRCYHLTHDYLIPSLREWITKQDKETVSGRAAIRLAERTAEWSARRSRRYLPSWWEWLVIVTCTRPARRTPAQRRLIAAATWYHAGRAAIAAAAVAILALVAVDRVGALRARYAVDELARTEAANVPRVLEDLASCRPQANKLLTTAIASPLSDSHQKARADSGSCRSTHRRPLCSYHRCSTKIPTTSA